MSIYEYVCDDCSELYERIFLNQSAPVTCPKCESANRTIQLSVFAAHGNGGKSSGSSSGSMGGGSCCGDGGCGCH
jgi:putative FmdB family regulatory protein